MGLIGAELPPPESKVGVDLDEEVPLEGGGPAEGKTMLTLPH